MKTNRKQILCVLAALTLLLIIGAAAGSRKKESVTHWQLIPQDTAPDFSGVPSGFEGVAFYADDVYSDDGIRFRLTEDSDTGILYAYVPAEMHDRMNLVLRESETLLIDGTAFQAGDELPRFEEERQYECSVLDAFEETVETKTVVFLYSENIPSMYIDTASGSMKAIDEDKHHETSEEATYRIYLTDGTPDAGGKCSIKGRGNSTWSQKKRPYNLNLARENVLLGMDRIKKYALIANFWDSTQTRQYYAFKAAEQLGLDYTPQTRFVNLYLNGRYQSLYLLTQRINVDGGTVDIRDLDAANARANRSADEPRTEVQVTDEKGNEGLAYAWRNEPDDLTGGYLIEFENRYDKEDLWFQTETEHMTFKSPQEPSIGEYQYISSYVREAEAALFGSGSGNAGGNDPLDENSSSAGNDSPAESRQDHTENTQSAETPEKSVWDYFDMDSWARMYLIQDFFVQSDDEYYSFFFYKKAGDPLLYCGPVWDFDLCLGNMNSGDYYKTSAQTLWLRDGRKKWLHQMDQYPEFRARVATLYLEELEPIIRNLLDNEYDNTVDLLEKDTGLNYLRWHKNLDYRERTGWVRDLMATRVQFLHDYYTDPDSFCRLLFHFAWDDFSYYVRRGSSMGFLPTDEYGEKQSGPQREANGSITGWQDAATGALLQAEEAIYEDREFDPVYAPAE